MKFRQKLAQFMAGRYGNDQLGYFLMILVLVISVVNLFFRLYVLSAVETIFFFLWLLRAMSRNTYKRNAENLVFLRIKDKVFGFLRFQKKRVNERKTAVYRHCPKCKATLRLPHSRGKHSVCCPKCGEHFKVHILF